MLGKPLRSILWQVNTVYRVLALQVQIDRDFEWEKVAFDLAH
ncbi:MAG: hypothetical protein ACRCVN_01815 [Spirochaetia bacterium]